MAANKKGSGTSKTAHVMNLLNKHRETPPAGDAQESTPPAAGEPADTAAEVVQTNTPTASPVDTIQQDTQAAEQIKSALEDALAHELDPVQPPKSPEPEPTPPPKPEPVLPQASVPPQPEPMPEPVPDLPESPPQPAPEPVSNLPEPVSSFTASPPESEPVPQQSESITSPPDLEQPLRMSKPDKEDAQNGDEVTYVNVMQILVEEKAEKYMQLFGLCCCPRCVIDVKALALNNLPPKYVVMRKGDMVPRITVYEGRYNAVITAQLMQACTAVQKAPHHSRKS